MSSGSGRRREAKPAELRVDARRNQQRILRAAAHVLADDPAAGMQRIADEAQVARLTVYRRYPTREALIEAILGEAVAEFESAMDEADSPHTDAPRAIGHLIRALAGIGAKYPILLQGNAASGQEPARHESGQTGHDTTAIVERFDALIARGQADGTVRPDLTPELLRYSLFGALAMSLRLARGRADDHLHTADDIGTQVASIIVDGLRPPAAREAVRAHPPVSP
ncbi:TetR/AcrR family transcriptional regulator [Streptomyces sp. NPDC004232]|uniref:TetR/AcrR family transcriptional regulator n=1 Tax=Streptomyces sp. NPDC004232 TaxID=3154454 RepID=UPI001D6DF065|nr:TetR/AcrR family transcriptional regulator [Streptomyces sp. tea 10]